MFRKGYMHADIFLVKRNCGYRYAECIISLEGDQVIINTGQRTDIPAFYPEWFINRIREGYVLVRNPYNYNQVTRYRLDPSVVDILCFCTKDPGPILKYLDEISAFRQYWFVTITPYGKDTEANVPPWQEVADSVARLSEKVGRGCVGWRYDPVFIDEKYTVGFHENIFGEMAEKLKDSCGSVTFSFIDLYEKTKKNMPEVKTVPSETQIRLAKAFKSIADENSMQIRSCRENEKLAMYGIDVAGCMTKQVLEEATGEFLDGTSGGNSILDCNCLLGHDIGQYNTCAHFCKYCYANYDRAAVRANMREHDPKSPFLIGGHDRDDRIHDAEQESYISGQMRMRI